MYIAVQHSISDPQAFWSAADPSALPPEFKLHHTFPTKDGRRAVCLWEAGSLRDVKAFIETYVGHVSRNLYFQVENREGISVPSELELPAEVADAFPRDPRLPTVPPRQPPPSGPDDGGAPHRNG